MPNSCGSNPARTFPGMLRELLRMDFPLVINAEVSLPDQVKVVKKYKSRLREMLAQKRMFFGGLPAMAGENLRGIEMLTANAADLLPVEVPWRGTPSSPLVLVETPTRQLIPFSLFDSSLADANALFIAKSGGG